MIHVFHNYINNTVTNHYISTIAKSLDNIKMDYDYVDFIPYPKKNGLFAIFNYLFHDFGYHGINKKDWIMVSHATEVVNLYFHGFRNIIFWSQGIMPEESYMKKGSKLRKSILDIFEKKALEYSKFTFLVSNAQKEYYENKYGINFKEKFFIMPCFNTTLDLESFAYPNKYSENIFTYAGSTASWQCFDETIKLFREIEKVVPNSKLRIFTADKINAKNVLNKYGVNNYSIDFVTPQQLSIELKSCKFGFIIREDNPINNVATPTKLSSYMAAGVIPIFTRAIKDFTNKTQNFKSVCPIDSLSDYRSIINFINSDINKELVEKEFVYLFDTYFNELKYIKQIGQKLQKILSLD